MLQLRHIPIGPTRLVMMGDLIRGGCGDLRRDVAHWHALRRARARGDAQLEVPPSTTVNSCTAIARSNRRSGVLGSTMTCTGIADSERRHRRFVPEGRHESSGLQRRQNLRGDAAADDSTPPVASAAQGKILRLVLHRPRRTSAVLPRTLGTDPRARASEMAAGRREVVDGSHRVTLQSIVGEAVQVHEARAAEHLFHLGAAVAVAQHANEIESRGRCGPRSPRGPLPKGSGPTARRSGGVRLAEAGARGNRHGVSVERRRARAEERPARRR